MHILRLVRINPIRTGSFMHPTARKSYINTGFRQQNRYLAFSAQRIPAVTTTNENWTTCLISGCTKEQRTKLLLELEKYNSENGIEEVSECSISQLKLIFIASTVPFIGFGFLDNFLMIVAGEYIDLTFATTFGFSTMAAAGLGNLVSDICGSGLVGYVEKYAALFGAAMPPLTHKQLQSTSAKRSGNWGRLFGISIGCILGMFPLLFLPDDSAKNEKKMT